MIISKTQEEITKDILRMLDHNNNNVLGSMEYLLRRELLCVNKEESYLEYKITVPNLADNETNTAHGGFLAAVLDEGMGYAARAFTCSGNTVKTASMQLNYLAAVGLGDELRLKVTIIHNGRRIVVTKGELYRKDKLVFYANGNFAKVEYNNSNEKK